MNARRGFSLIEILIVVAIIVVLAAILFPVIARSKENASRASALSQVMQIGLALQLYGDDHNNRFLPSTNHGVSTDLPERIWTGPLHPFLGERTVFVAPGTSGKFPERWEDRGWGTIGYSQATAVDTEKGCPEGVVDAAGCHGFESAAAFDEADSPAQVGLLAVTPGGPTEAGYRGYEFNPYGGLPNPENPKIGAPMASDRDLVAELPGIDPELAKPIHARYGSTGRDDGTTPVGFADHHAKTFSARAIAGMGSGIVWRFR